MAINCVPKRAKIIFQSRFQAGIGNFSKYMYQNLAIELMGQTRTTIINLSYLLRLFITVSSRSCSGAPSISERRCSGHVVNALRTEICLCGTNGCNGIENHGMNVEDKIINHYSSGRGCVFHTERRLFVGTAIILAKLIVYDF